MKTQQKRVTIYLESNLHKALRLKAAETDRTISEIVSRAVQPSLAEDAEDLAAFPERACEPNLPFERVRRRLQR